MKTLTALLISPLVLAPLAKVALAQTTPLAPPVSVPSDSLWAWQDIPRNERVPIVRAVFDQGGYLLYDTNGQVISVPFTGSNLYVMQFGRTSGGMFFVNEDGRSPTLYLPNDGFLENGSVGGARWYPFPQRYFYTRPVFVGPAPSWDAYCNMGWYSSTVIYGGYWCDQPWRYGITMRPLPGLFITVNGRSCNNWDDYTIYYRTAPVRPVIIVNQPIYRERVIVSRPDRVYERPIYRESARPDYKAPARESEIRAQQSGSAYQRDQRPSFTPSRETRPGGMDRTFTPSRDNNPIRERREPLPNYTPPSVREQRPGFSNDRPTYTPPSRESFPGRDSRPIRESFPGRDSSPVREMSTRTAPTPSRESSPIRERIGSGSSSSSSRERERGKR